MITSLMLTVPQSSCSAMRSARLRSLVQTLADSPYSLSFARAIAVDSSENRMIGSVGPKVSSLMQSMEWSTSTSTVGA
ncbi:Uncharacterised protein [Mycobacteroides abscessus subsp. massiliense]|nr:Uncharacterised protein [Mycobacteroides abscessus subsp. massiliense]